MRGLTMTMTVLALNAMSTIAQAGTSSNERPAAPAPEVVIPREVPAGETSATDSAAPAPETSQATSSSAPASAARVETVRIPAESPAPAPAPAGAPAAASASPAPPPPTSTRARAPRAPVVVISQSYNAPAHADSPPAEAAAPLPVLESPPPVNAAVSVEPVRAAINLPVAGTGFGAETRYWTSLQLSGAVASKQERPLPGAVGSKVYKRYEDSFTHPIPERFPRDSFSSAGTGGGGSR